MSLPHDYFECPGCNQGFCGPGPTCDACARKPADVTPDPEAPLRIEDLPDFWDARRARQEKPDKSTCAAELRVALKKSAHLGRLTVRRISCDVGCDERTVKKEIDLPGSTRGIVGERIRARLAELPGGEGSG